MGIETGRSMSPASAWGAGISMALVLLLVVGPVGFATAAETITVDAGNVDGTIPAIHGTNSGPLIRAIWNPPCGNTQPGNHSSRYTYANIPQARTHGTGSLDMSQIWVPWPSFNGQDPTLAVNYNWSAADDAISAAMAVSEAYLRFGESANHGISSGGGCDPARPTATPPDDFLVFAQVCKQILRHFMQGWDGGFQYDIKYAEVWNEFYIPDFWTGTGQEAAQLYETVHDELELEFPNVQLGASISLQYLQSGFGQYVVNNPGMTIDYVAPHSYRRMPYNMRLAVHENLTGNWEAAFVALGLPSNTPIMFTEWNREGGCYNGGNQGGLSAIPIGAHLIGTLIEMAQMHPTNSTHNVIMGHYFSAGKQIWDSNSVNRSAGVALDAYGHHLYGETPLKVATTGSNSDDLDTDFLAMAGKSADDTKLNVLVSYYETSAATCPLVTGLPVTLNVVVNNFPWVNADFTWERWVHTSTSQMTREAFGVGTGGSFSTTQTMNENAFELYKFAVVSNPAPSLAPTAITILVLSLGAAAARVLRKKPDAKAVAHSRS